MKKIEKIFELPESTWLALEELAEITGAEDVEELFKDALRTYEWLIYQQSAGYTIVAQSGDELSKLRLPPDREVLADLIKEGAQEKAKRYFAAANSTPA